MAARAVGEEAGADILEDICVVFAGFVVAVLPNVGIPKQNLTYMIGYGLSEVIISNLHAVATTGGEYLVGIVMFTITNLVCYGTLPGGYQLYNSPLSNLNIKTKYQVPSQSVFPTPPTTLGKFNSLSSLKSSLASAFNNPLGKKSFRHISGTPSVMHTNQYMRKGDQLVASSGYYALKFLVSGEIAVFDATTSPQAFIYTLDTNPSNFYLLLTTDGDLVTLDTNKVIIRTVVVNTMQSPDVTLTMQSDGNLVMYNTSNTSLSLWNSTCALPVVAKTYLYSINGNYLVLENYNTISTTTNVNYATPVYIDTWAYSSTSTVFPIKTANQKYYISGSNNVATYTNTISSTMILYSKENTTYINIVGGYYYLSDPPYFQNRSVSNLGIIWNVMPNIAQLTSSAQIMWFNTPTGISWMQSSDGILAMSNPTAINGLANTSAWISGSAGQWWISSSAGQNWLNSFNGQNWLQTVFGTNWLVSSVTNLKLADNISWLQSVVGKSSMGNPTFVMLLINGPRNWALTAGGQWWTSSPVGQTWLISVDGQSWLKNAQNINNPTAQNWLSTPSGQNWLITSSGQNWVNSVVGRNWLLTSSGEKWLSTPSGQNNWVNTASGQSWLSTSFGQSWLSTPSGQIWLATSFGQNWLSNSIVGQTWLNSVVGRNWLLTSSGQNWLNSAAGQRWIIANPSGQTWKQNWIDSGEGHNLNSVAGQSWLITLAGQSWLTTPSGKQWVLSSSGQTWLNNGAGHNLNSLTGQSWLATPTGLNWLKSFAGQKWTRSITGETWLMSNAGLKWSGNQIN